MRDLLLVDVRPREGQQAGALEGEGGRAAQARVVLLREGGREGRAWHALL